MKASEQKAKVRWFLLRSSLHDPVMVLNIEGDEKVGVNKYAKQIVKWFGRSLKTSTRAIAKFNTKGKCMYVREKAPRAERKMNDSGGTLYPGKVRTILKFLLCRYHISHVQYTIHL